jgi:hypothetical protein
MKKLQIRFTSLIFLIVLFVFILTSCKNNDDISRFNKLPDLPSSIVEKLNPVKMTTAPLLTLPVPLKKVETSVAPCCSITINRSLKVTYPFTKCVPFSDYYLLEAPSDLLMFNAEEEQEDDNNLNPTDSFKKRKKQFHKLKRAESSKSLKDIYICTTSEGPWNAELIETQSCNIGNGKSFTLIVSAFDEIIVFNWNGAVDGHNPEIGLVDCRTDSVIRSNCGISTCDCSSFLCPPEDPCNCSIDTSW